MRDFIDSPRRVMGVIFLAIALVMAFFGPTSLHGRFGTVGFAVYWLICAAFTVLAACVALVDLFRVKKESRTAQLDMIEKTLETGQFRTESPKTKGSDSDESV